jgi:hypothetical protein
MVMRRISSREVRPRIELSSPHRRSDSIPFWAIANFYISMAERRSMTIRLMSSSTSSASRIAKRPR